MSRTIKYRLWAKPEGHYIDAITPAFGYAMAAYLTRAMDSTFQRADFDDNLVLEQFTGLVDSKRREIYEGDIVWGVQPIGTYGNVILRNHAGNVVWDDERGGWYMDGEYPEPRYLLSLLTQRKVWGNIHEPARETS